MYYQHWYHIAAIAAKKFFINFGKSSLYALTPTKFLVILISCSIEYQY